ncbi:hypothetical protein WR25_02620 [Diploscapter pachys]|uniref:Uncharacterized protein n=1 Tax=Diploscapter pachys TaxID=2018661 RepID=A0A2A2LVF8_9BILA|nr:hypothetical protein WR25_02620 [Diploscapter pachys]
MGEEITSRTTIAISRITPRCIITMMFTTMFRIMIAIFRITTNHIISNTIMEDTMNTATSIIMVTTKD